MKLPLILFLILSFTFAQAQEASVWCDDKYSSEVREIDNKLVTRVDSCVADVVWGAENVCFEGSAEALVSRINNGDFVWASLYAESAQINPEDGKSILFIGVDQQNFYSGQNDIFPCHTDF